MNTTQAQCLLQSAQILVTLSKNSALNQDALYEVRTAYWEAARRETNLLNWIESNLLSFVDSPSKEDEKKLAQMLARPSNLSEGLRYKAAHE